jgi:hypothetical protein
MLYFIYLVLPENPMIRATRCCEVIHTPSLRYFTHIYKLLTLTISFLNYYALSIKIKLEKEVLEMRITSLHFRKTARIIKLKKRSYTLFVICLCLLLKGCGGSTSKTIEKSDIVNGTIIPDKTSPVITLNGLSSVKLLQGSSYDDMGAMAVDNIDGDITASIVVTTNLDVHNKGSYHVFYNVSDSSNNYAAEMQREIIVASPESEFSFYGANQVVTINSGSGGFDGVLNGGDRFGRDHAMIGDINGDGVDDLALGARSDDDGEIDAGAVYILMMNEQGSVNSYQKISMLYGNFSETLLPGNFFGYGVAGIGDIDKDGIPDIAVTAPTQVNQALYVLHLNRNGTVKNWTKTVGIFGQGLSSIGDIDGDGRIDLVAANPISDDGGRDRGAIDILFLNENSSVELAKTVTISSTQGGFGVGLIDGDQFGGRESAILGDMDGDGTIELAVGSFMSDEGRGAIWILSLDKDNFNVISKFKIGSMQGGFDEELPNTINSNGSYGAQFGHALAYVGDLNGDGIGDLVTAANQLNEGYGYLLYLNADKSLKAFNRINNNEGGFDLNLELTERFGRSISFMPEANEGDGITINMGGGAGGTGTMYSLQYKACDISLIEGNNYWQSENTLFSNWNHTNQTVSESLSFEQCLQKSMVYKGSKITFNPADSRCIINSQSAELFTSIEGSMSYLNQCF